MKIVKLDINPEMDLAGVDAVALVEKPAIEEDFMYFSKEEFAETYTDYPEGAVEAAKMGIKRNEAIDNKCATQVGKVRAQQLANREPISLDTVRRMRSFLIRQKGNYELAQERGDYNACGYISYLLWGGPEALSWSEKVLRQIDNPEEFNFEAVIKEEIIKAEMLKIKSIGDKIQHLTTGKSMDDTFSDSNMVVDNSMVFSQKKTIYLVSCSSQKLNKPAKAKDLYTSPTFEKSLNYCYSKGATDKDIKILSGKYGLVDMNTIIKPYDVYLGDKSAEQKKAWAEDVFKVLKRRYDLETTKFEFLAGNDYTQYLEDMLPKSKDVLEGKKVGERLQYLDKFAALDEQQIVIGPLMKPNMLIPRLDENGEPYQVYFTEDTIKKIAYKMIKDKLIDKVNLEHNNDDTVNAYLVESWIIDGDNDKSKNYGFNLPQGTWMGMYKIEDKKIWDEYIKSGLVKGFSVEGIFGQYAMDKCKVGKPCACGKSESGLCDGSHNNK